jgi:hypothetical protein
MITTIINKEISIFDKFGKIEVIYPNGILIESNFIIINDFYKIESKIYENISYTDENKELIICKGSNISNNFQEYINLQINWASTPKNFDVIKDNIIETVNTYIMNIIKNYCLLQSNDQYKPENIYQQIN